MSEREIEIRLAAANERLREATAALAPKHKGGEWEEYHAAREHALALERELAAARGEEYAEPLDFPVRWDVGAPLPHLLQSDYQCLLIFHLAARPDPAWNGETTRIVSPADADNVGLAVVEFKGVVAAKLGAPDDEVFAGHPLSGRGGHPYTAQEVINSRWLRELQAINSVHSRYNPDRWLGLHHYILWFHDSTFECVARDFEVSLSTESFANLLVRASLRFID
jgi:hypothetical protein